MQLCGITSRQHNKNLKKKMFTLFMYIFTTCFKMFTGYENHDNILKTLQGAGETTDNFRSNM